MEKEAYSLEDTIDSLLMRAKQQRRFSFVALLNEVTVRAAKVTMFIAVLELLKRQIFTIHSVTEGPNDGSLKDVTLVSEIV